MTGNHIQLAYIFGYVIVETDIITDVVNHSLEHLFVPIHVQRCCCSYSESYLDEHYNG
jgi:hypothetical protein